MIYKAINLLLHSKSEQKRFCRVRTGNFEWIEIHGNLCSAFIIYIYTIYREIFMNMNEMRHCNEWTC